MKASDVDCLLIFDQLLLESAPACHVDQWTLSPGKGAKGDPKLIFTKAFLYRPTLLNARNLFGATLFFMPRMVNRQMT